MYAAVWGKGYHSKIGTYDLSSKAHIMILVTSYQQFGAFRINLLSGGRGAYDGYWVSASITITISWILLSQQCWHWQKSVNSLSQNSNLKWRFLLSVCHYHSLLRQPSTATGPAVDQKVLHITNSCHLCLLMFYSSLIACVTCPELRNIKKRVRGWVLPLIVHR